MAIVSRTITSPEWPFHEVTHCIPEMSIRAYHALVESIEQNGLREPILLDDKGEKIIDGRYRYLACCELGIEPQYRTWDGVGDMQNVVISLNAHRQHFTDSQSAMIARNAIPLLQKYGKNGAENGEGRKYTFTNNAIKAAANMVGISPLDVRHAIYLGKHGIPELNDAVFSGVVPLTAAAFVAANYKRKDQARIIAGGKEAVVDAVKAILEQNPFGHKACDLLPSFGRKNSKALVTKEQADMWFDAKVKEYEQEGRKDAWVEVLLKSFELYEVIEISTLDHSSTPGHSPTVQLFEVPD